MTPVEEAIREELRERRQRLLANANLARESELVELLRRVDTALERLTEGDWGRCLACNDTIDPKKMVADPLTSICLECLSPGEQQALENDLATAARVQAAFLAPPQFDHGCWKGALLWEPSGPVSGDYYDLILPGDGTEGIQVVLGDVVGKGVAASLLQAHLSALMRSLATPEVSLGDLLNRLNSLLERVTLPEAYVTMVVSRLCPGGRINLASAGHPPPLMADQRGVRPIEGGGLPLGLFSEARYEEREILLEPEDTLFFYTDGLTEAASDLGAYGVGRAAASLRRTAGQSLSELLSRCRQDLSAFLDGATMGDDLTLVAIRRVE